MIVLHNESVARLALRWLLAGVFVYAGASKLTSVGAFAVAVASYQLVSVGLIGAVAWGLPLYEILCGLLVLAPTRLRRIGLAGMTLMTLAFSAALASALGRGLVIDCGCFGGNEASEAGLVWALIRSILLLAMAVYLYAQELPAAPPDRA